MMEAVNPSDDDPKIVGGEKSAEDNPSILPPAKNPQSEFLETATKQHQRKLRYQQEKATTDSSWVVVPSFLGGAGNASEKKEDLNQLFRKELEEGRVRPIQEEHSKKSDLDTFVNRLSKLSTDDLEAFIDQNAADLDQSSTGGKKDRIEITGGSVRGASNSDPSRSRNTVTETDDHDGLDSNHKLPLELQNESESQLSTPSNGSKNQKITMSSAPPRRKSQAATAQNELLAESIQKIKQQQQQRSSFFGFFSDGSNRENQDLNDVLRQEMRKMEASRSSSSSSGSIKKEKSKDQERDGAGNDNVDTMPIHAVVSEAANAAATSSDMFTGVKERTSYVGEALLAPASFLHNSVSNLLFDHEAHEDDDAVEALHNRDLDESPDSAFVLHLVS